MLDDVRLKFINDDYLIEQYERKQGLSPLEIIIQKEERQAIVNIVMQSIEILKGNDKQILEMYVIDGWNQCEIAKQIGISQPAVNKRLQKIPTIIEKWLLSDTLYYCKELLCDKPSMKEAKTPQYHIGWLVNRLQKINNGGHWTDKRKAIQQHKQQEYVSESKCEIPATTIVTGKQIGRAHV